MRRLAHARERGDEGAVAILTAIVVTLVLLPLCAVAMTSYTRSAVGSEVQRSADSGALAGATGIGLLNLSAIPQAQLLNPLLNIGPASKPFEQACLSALTAYGIPSPVAATASNPRPAIVDGTVNDNSPVGRAFGDVTRCTARYAPDPIFSQCIGQVTSVVNGVLNGTLVRFVNLVNLVRGIPLVGPGLATTLQSALGLPSQLTDVVTKLLPALAHNGVVVDVDYTVEGPLDGLLSADPANATARATGRRVFKPLLPAGIAGLSGPTQNPLLAPTIQALDPTVTTAEALVVAQLQLVLGVLRTISDPAGVPAATLTPLLQSVDAITQTLLGPVLTNPLVSGLLGGAATPSLAGVGTQCLAAVDDLLEDLQSALTINYDVTDATLLHCLTEQVLGASGTLLQRVNLTTTEACVNKVFRSIIVNDVPYSTLPHLP